MVRGSCLYGSECSLDIEMRVFDMSEWRSNTRQTLTPEQTLTTPKTLTRHRWVLDIRAVRVKSLAQRQKTVQDCPKYFQFLTEVVRTFSVFFGDYFSLQEDPIQGTTCLRATSIVPRYNSKPKAPQELRGSLLERSRGKLQERSPKLFLSRCFFPTALEAAGLAHTVPIVSIVLPFLVKPTFICRILYGNPQKRTSMETIGTIA